MHILLSNSQAGHGRTVKQEQEEISRNHVQAFISPSVQKPTKICKSKSVQCSPSPHYEQTKGVNQE